jgi:hypothetical protein
MGIDDDNGGNFEMKQNKTHHVHPVLDVVLECPVECLSPIDDSSPPLYPRDLHPRAKPSFLFSPS